MFDYVSLAYYVALNKGTTTSELADMKFDVLEFS